MGTGKMKISCNKYNTLWHDVVLKNNKGEEMRRAAMFNTRTKRAVIYASKFIDGVEKSIIERKKIKTIKMYLPDYNAYHKVTGELIK